MNPDVALELGWMNGYCNFVIPFLIQTFRHTRPPSSSTTGNNDKLNPLNYDTIMSTF